MKEIHHTLARAAILAEAARKRATFEHILNNGTREFLAARAAFDAYAELVFSLDVLADHECATSPHLEPQEREDARARLFR